MLKTAMVRNIIIEKVLDYTNTLLQKSHWFEQISNDTKRLTFNFGYDYYKMTQGDNSFIDIPEVLQELCANCKLAIESKHDLKLPDKKEFRNIIISYYQPGDKLEPHIDVDFSKRETGGTPTKFYFGDDIIGVIIQADTEGKLYLTKSIDGSKPTYNNKTAQFLEEKDGLCFVLSREERKHPYFHGVSTVKEKRISVTFRTVEFI